MAVGRGGDVRGTRGPSAPGAAPLGLRATGAKGLGAALFRLRGRGERAGRVWPGLPEPDIPISPPG